MNDIIIIVLLLMIFLIPNNATPRVTVTVEQTKRECYTHSTVEPLKIWHRIKCPLKDTIEYDTKNE